MAKMFWAVICNRIIVDKPTNSISYIDCIERVKAGELPANLFQCSIGTMWKKTKENDSVNLRLFLKAPESKEELQILETKEHVLSSGNATHRMNFQLDGMPIEKEGTYYFIIRQLQDNNWVDVIELSFDVVKADTKELAV